MSKNDDSDVMPHVFGAMVILACVPKVAQEESLAMLHTLLGAETYHEALLALTTEFALQAQQTAFMEATGGHRNG